ncbi:MAG TPA: GNAT family N-acetyltransferase [Chitinophagaceae bacterium]|jgi:GNAT superfamily N-acetyltransferase|nr:GNAT family N-acetyltransferase [Chitinophagaceae bacterium]
MDKIIIRKAVLSDMETLLRFEQGVINAERPFDPTLKGDPNYYYDIGAMIAASHIELLVVETSNEIIGSGYARIDRSEPYLRHEQHAYFGFMYVDPAHRGKGVNKMIVDALEQWSLSQGITEMRLEVYVGNAAAISAYEKVGFVKHMTEMRKGLIKE